VVLNLLLSLSIESGPSLSSDGRMRTLAHCYSDVSSNGLCDVTGARCYCDRAPLSVT
jgi:hypothetical protein